MAITLTKVYGPTVVGDRWEVCYTAALTNSYTTGGDSLKPSDLGLSDNDPAFTVTLEPLAGGWLPTYDYTAKKLMLWSASSSASTQVVSTTDVSAQSVRVTAKSKYRN